MVRLAIIDDYIDDRFFVKSPVTTKIEIDENLVVHNNGLTV